LDETERSSSGSRLSFRAVSSGACAARRSTRRHDALRINPQTRGMSPHPAHGALCVLDAFLRAGLVGVADAVFRRCRDHAAFGQVPGPGGELLGRSAHKTAAEEENDSGPLIGRLPSRGMQKWIFSPPWGVLLKMKT
jgi:hypothetical protein